MALAYIVIDTVPGMEHEVYRALLKFPEVRELYLLFGGYDIIAKLEASGFEDMGALVVNRIRRVQGVADTKTLTVLEL